MNAQEFIGRIDDYIRAHELLDEDGTVLVTLSGGADSVALLRVLLAMGYSCVAAHCNFHLRGEESDRDEKFVRRLCDSLNVPLHVKHFNVAGRQRERGISVEMACRELRYEWFASLAGECSCQAIAVAHHRDDNIETFFLNSLRTSGIKGVAGMRPRNNAVVRPLLCVSRREVEEYLVEIGQQYIVDSTNLENDYKRNKLRNAVLPALEREFPEARRALAGTIENLRACSDLYDDLINDLKNRVMQQDGAVICLSIEALKHFNTVRLPLLLFELTKPYGFAYDQCENMAAVIVANSMQGQVFYSSTNTLSLNSELIIIEELNTTDIKEYNVDFTHLSELKVKLKLKHPDGIPFTPSMCNGKTVVAFDKALLESRKVVLRHWREGDRMRPFGLHGSKLVSDLFADAKLSPEAKKLVWIMEADGEIIWVLGMRAADAYMVGRNSTKYVLLTYRDC